MTSKSQARRGVSLIELSISLTIMGILISFAAPSFSRAVEQSKADVAGANLRAVWSSQRLYRLDNPAYASDLSTLVAAGLLDANFLGGSGSGSGPAPYTFTVASADNQGFAVNATRVGGVWSGTFSIDQSGTITGTLTKAGEVNLSPAFM